MSENMISKNAQDLAQTFSDTEHDLDYVDKVLDNFANLNDEEFSNKIAERYIMSFDRSKLISRNEHKKHLIDMRAKRRNKFAFAYNRRDPNRVLEFLKERIKGLDNV